jgi:hypothetical protein
VSTAAAAADDPKPDYSPQTLRQIFAHTDEWQPKPRSTVRWGLGSVEFKAFGMNWRILYLPIAMPFSGSVRGSNPSTMWPDPFALTGTEFATTPRNWHDNREISKERRRIEKSVKERAKVKVEP